MRGFVAILYINEYTGSNSLFSFWSDHNKIAKGSALINSSNVHTFTLSITFLGGILVVHFP